MDRKKALIKKLKNFRKKTTKKIVVEKMILFGSRAKGRPTKDSDVDLIIVSKKFKKFDFLERGAKMYDYWSLPYPVDFLCYTPEEFETKRKHLGIVQQAVKEGIEIL